MKKILLTFDDGPNKNTLEILKILEKFGAKATFFVLGKNCQKYPQILKEIFKKGHGIGNHSFSHSLFFFFNFKKEIEKTQKIIKEILNFEPKIFRPPWGFLPFWLKNYLLKEGFKIFLWDKDLSWKSAKKLQKKVKDKDIILLHDGQRVVENLPELLHFLKREGFSFETLPS